MTSRHLFHLPEMPPEPKTEGGFRLEATKKIFPILNGMSLYKLVLEPNGIREPHWHPNAIEMGYCLKGKVLVSFYATGDHRESFIIEPGDAFLIPSGAIHCIENLGNEACEVILTFNHEEPEEFGLSASLGFLSNSVLGNTWHIQSEDFENLRKSTKNVFATLRKGNCSISEEAKYVSDYKFSLEKAQPLLSNTGGLAKMAKQSTWPMAKQLALYSLHLSGVGMREPHWHPETAELGYIHSGKGRMSILKPDGTVDTYEMKDGDMYFIPKAYPHHIENLEDSELHLLIFFDQGMPSDIGFTGSIRSFSNEVLGSVMKTEPKFFNQLTKYYKDLFIVEKINPLD